MLHPSNRVAMVSGASRGIGRAVADRLEAVGYRVSGGSRRSGNGRPTETRHGFCYEASDPSAADAWVSDTLDRFGRIDVLINAAGISPMANVLDADETALDALWAVNVKAPMRLVRAAWPHLVTSGEGRVVNIASLSGKRVRNDNTGYAMSKSALITLTHAIRRQGWEHGIRASAFCPGFVDTDMTAHVTTQPRELMSRPEDLAAVIETIVRLPNTAAIAELLLNCRHEDLL